MLGGGPDRFCRELASRGLFLERVLYPCRSRHGHRTKEPMTRGHAHGPWVCPRQRKYVRYNMRSRMAGIEVAAERWKGDAAQVAGVGQFVLKVNACECGGVVSDVIEAGGARRTRCRRASEERTVVARVSSSTVRT